MIRSTEYTIVALTAEDPAGAGGLDPRIERVVVTASAPGEALTYALQELSDRDPRPPSVWNAMVFEGRVEDLNPISEFGVEQQYEGILAGEHLAED